MSDTGTITQHSVDLLCKEFTQDIQHIHTKPWILTALLSAVTHHLPRSSPQTIQKYINTWFKSQIQETNNHEPDNNHAPLGIHAV